ncbi:MAG: TraR/DksA C4-type zinc finger protein [Ignavibacteriales bacterium]
MRAREHLLAEENRLVSQLERLNAHGLRLGAKDSVQELSLYDNHPADVGSETYEREKDLGLKDNVEIMLQKTREALRRIDQGAWGFCERCGRMIESARLEAMPMTTLCLHCKEEQEATPKASSRPVEEDVVTPPFNLPADERESLAYDGADTWEDVAIYGSAYTPQDQPGSTDYDDLYLEEPPDSGAAQYVDRIIDRGGDVMTEGVRRKKPVERKGRQAH